MDFSRFGPLAQMFVIDALSKWSDMIANTPIDELRSAFEGNPLIGAEAWQSMAREIKEKRDAHFARQN
ncbi:hypothetical protein ACI2TT_25410 [Ralstonia nicotianae]|uniref:hypothetical protein n=1 Tax=Ralstonia solanacearum species complex TaxID=3116862 RepID=UPI0002E2959C|nr:hypothetical protein [Ralstonia pseudosolanacearum]MCK4125859.1 hypothetical protein [Ralstonia pseudosolanacearum]QIK17907.1 hypothetical protein G7968_05425 [Ralstonia solanacearum]